MEEKKIGYEYKEIVSRRSMESLWIDSMENLGWELCRKNPKVIKRLPAALWIVTAPLSLLPWRPFQKALTDHNSEKLTVLEFKRGRQPGDSPLKDRQELNHLQSRFECCMRAIDGLEGSKESGAFLSAVLVGGLGTVFLSLSVFLYLAGSSPLFIIAAVPGFLGWILPFFIFRKMKSDRSRMAEAEIEEQQNQIYEIGRKANRILANEVA